MTKKEDAINHRSGPLTPDRAACNNAEDRVARALETLRLLNDKNNPLSLRQAIEHARDLAQTFARWEQSGTLIKDIAVRLSDGQEIAVDQSNVSSLCGLRFRNAFPSDSVLHIWKKADEQFGEVQLLSLSLRDVQPNGYQYEKAYKNGQSLSLKVTRYPDGQFYISVDCSAKERAMVATPRTYGWLGIIGPLVLALLNPGSFLRKPQTQPKPRWYLQPSAAFAAGLVFATVACLLLLRGSLCEVDFNRTTNISAELPVPVPSETQQTLDLRQAEITVRPAVETRDEDGAKQGLARALKNAGVETGQQAGDLNRDDLSTVADRSTDPETVTPTAKVVTDAVPGAAQADRGAKTGEARTLARPGVRSINYAQSSSADAASNASNYLARTYQTSLIVRAIRLMDKMPRSFRTAGRTSLIRADYIRPVPAQRPSGADSFSTVRYSIVPTNKP